MEDTDLEGLSPQDATEYVLAFITTLKKTEMDLARASEDVALWMRRVALAQDKGEAVLAAQAQARLAEMEAKKAQLEGEALDLKHKISVMKDKLVRIRMQVPRSVNVDLLLAELQMLVGEKDSLSLSLKDEEAKMKLEELKRKMSGGGSSPSGTPRGGAPGGAAPESKPSPESGPASDSSGAPEGSDSPRGDPSAGGASH
jgi:phage shock protein A